MAVEIGEKGLVEVNLTIPQGTSMTSSYSSGTITLNVKTPLPTVTSTDDGKVLKVVNGAWAVADA